MKAAKSGEIETLLTRFVRPFLTQHGQNCDEFFIGEMSNGKWTRETKMKFLDLIADQDQRKGALFEFLLTIEKPWPKNIEAFALKNSKTA